MSNRTPTIRAEPTSHIGPNMTPMVDIVMCILIFMMLTTSFATAEVFLTHNMLPSSRGPGTVAQIAPLPPVEVTVTIRRMGSGAGEVRLSNSRLADFVPVAKIEEIGASLQKLRESDSGENVLVIISPQNSVSYDDVIKIYDACVKAKLSKVAFRPAGE